MKEVRIYNKGMVSVNVTSNEQHTIFTKGSTQITVNTDELIAALSELTGGQTWEDWMRRAEYAAAEYTKPIPIRGAKMQACTYKYMLDWIRDNVPLLPNTVGEQTNAKVNWDDIKSKYTGNIELTSSAFMLFEWLKKRYSLYPLPDVGGGWIKVEDANVECGIELLGYNEEWIDEDFNPDGICLCAKADDGLWTISKWSGYHDEYQTCYSEKWGDNHEEGTIIPPPTHYMKKPLPPATNQNEIV